MRRCLAFVGAVAFVAACGSSSGDDSPASSGGKGAGAQGGSGAKGGTTASGGAGGTGASTGGSGDTGGTTNGAAGDTSEAGDGPDDGGAPGSGGSSAGSGTGGSGTGGTGGGTGGTGGTAGKGGGEPSAGAGNEGGTSDFCLVGEQPGPITSFDEPNESGTTPDGAEWELGHSMTSDDVSVGIDGPGRGNDGYAAFLAMAATEQQSGSIHLEFATPNGCYDAAAFEGFSFYAKGELAGGTAQVIVHTFVDSYTTYFDVPSDWAKQTVTFADFTTGEEYEPWDPTRITEIEFATSGGPIDFWVDDLSWQPRE